MTIQTLNNIFRQVVIDMAYAPGYQIDAYRYVDGYPDLAHQALGATYQDYLDGAFWSRKFVHAGADPNAFCAGFPVLFAESRDLTVECLDSQDLRIEYYFLVVDRIECESCPPYVTRTGATVSESVLAMLRAFLGELYTYGLYEVDRDSVITYEWMSSGRAAYEESLGNTTVLQEELLPDVAPDEIQISEWGEAPNQRAWMARVVFTLCEPVTLEFDYATPVVPGLASIECPC